MAHRKVLSSARLALLLVAYNCLALPVAGIVLVFAWRLVNVSIYGYNRYSPGEPALLFVVAAVGAEAIAVTRLADARNVWGLVAGLTISLMFFPVTLAVIILALGIGNR